MKYPPFAYARAHSLSDVFSLLEQYGETARILAGGQSLLPTLAYRLSNPSLLIDITRLTDLRFIDERDGAIRIGALTRHHDLETSPLIATQIPLIAQAMPHVAHAAIRSRGTIGGSVALADPAAELPACLVALDATIVVASRQGERTIPASAFFRGLYDTELKPGEILVRIEVIPKPNLRYHFGEFSRRCGDFAIVGLAAGGVGRAGELSDPKLIFLNCGSRPVRAAAAEALVRKAGARVAIRSLRSELEKDLRPTSDVHASAAMRMHLASVLAARALAHLATLGHES